MQTSTHATRTIGMLVAIGMVLATACGGSSGGGSSTSSATIGASGGEISSRDGLLSIRFPLAALDEDTPIGVERVDGAEVAAAFGGVAPDVAYDLTPDGLTLNAPARATLLLDDAMPAVGDFMPLTLLANVTDAGAEALSSQRMRIDDDAGSVQVSGDVEHFSYLTEIPPRQVFVEVKLVEASTNFAQEIGVELRGLGGVNADGVTLSATDDAGTLLGSTPLGPLDGSADTVRGTLVVGDALSGLVERVQAIVALENPSFESSETGIELVVVPRVRVDRGIDLPIRPTADVELFGQIFTFEGRPQFQGSMTLLPTGTTVFGDLTGAKVVVELEQDGEVVRLEGTTDDEARASFLTDIPTLGLLFMKPERAETRDELVIFIKARILEVN